MCLVCAAADSTIKLRNNEYPCDQHVSSTFRSFASFRRSFSQTPRQTHNDYAASQPPCRHKHRSTDATTDSCAKLRNTEYPFDLHVSSTFRSFALFRCDLTAQIRQTHTSKATLRPQSRYTHAQQRCIDHATAPSKHCGMKQRMLQCKITKLKTVL